MPRSIICRIQLMCPRSAHSVGFLKVFAGQGPEDRFCINRHSDLHAQAAHLKYILQPSGCQRPRVEFMQCNDRGIAVLQVVGCCKCFL
eukprot:199583-Pyramimonas_sp.AAC.1